MGKSIGAGDQTMLASDGASALEGAENHFFPQRTAIQEDLRSGREIDYNSLSSTGKRAAFTLLQEGKARLISKNGRRCLVARRPSFLLQMLTGGFAR